MFPCDPSPCILYFFFLEHNSSESKNICFLVTLPLVVCISSFLKKSPNENIWFNRKQKFSLFPYDYSPCRLYFVFPLSWKWFILSEQTALLETHFSQFTLFSENGSTYTNHIHTTSTPSTPQPHNIHTTTLYTIHITNTTSCDVRLNFEGLLVY